jgi:hypothetical protein
MDWPKSKEQKAKESDIKKKKTKNKRLLTDFVEEAFGSCGRLESVHQH